LSFGKRSESHGAKFAALVGRGNLFVIQPEVHAQNRAGGGQYFDCDPMHVLLLVLDIKKLLLPVKKLPFFLHN
jgi:hypothetical protein